MSDPIVVTPNTKRRITIEKAQRKHVITLNANKIARELEAKKVELEKEKRKHLCFEVVLKSLNASGYTFGEMVMYFLDPESSQGNVSWHQFHLVSG